MRVSQRVQIQFLVGLEVYLNLKVVRDTGQKLQKLRQVIGLRSYGQRDPLVEYKKEAFELFENLLVKLKSDLITILINLSIVKELPENIEEKNETINIKKKMKRNEPCFCGSGKKYKHCHGAL